MKHDITYCSGCDCMTKSLRKGRATWLCAKCGHDKSLGDIFQAQLKEDLKEE